MVISLYDASINYDIIDISNSDSDSDYSDSDSDSDYLSVDDIFEKLLDDEIYENTNFSIHIILYEHPPYNPVTYLSWSSAVANDNSRAKIFFDEHYTKDGYPIKS
jgi:hypothetical protein